MYVQPATDDPGEADKIVDRGRRCWADSQRFMQPAVYINGLEDMAEQSAIRVHEAYGINYRRVAALKAQYDPTNFLSANVNIKPAA